ncbi:MAG TPA: hypothetical protein ENF73_05040 [Proteobacteria bacterium]|nr:hypothetical protein [Pseudomonadota bacterium]
MAGFFDGVVPGDEVTYGKATFRLPILYFRDDFFALFFSADADRVRAALPSNSLHPLTMKGRAFIGIGAYNYIDTSIGPYGEVGVVVPVVYGRKPAPILPLLMESRYSGFGMVVLHLPVTTLVARDAGRGVWGYPKFTSDMRFVITPEFMECRLSEGGKHIFTIRVARRGIPIPDRRPLITYTVKDGDLIKTTVQQRAIFRVSFKPRGSFLELGDHEVADSLRDLGISTKPIQSRYALQRFGILPEGEVIESGVRPLEGYRGQDREGSLEVAFTED